MPLVSYRLVFIFCNFFLLFLHATTAADEHTPFLTWRDRHFCLAVQPLVDRKLCNNKKINIDGTTDVNQNLCFTRTGTACACDARNVPADQCKEAIINVRQLDFLLLLELLESFDENDSIRRISVHFNDSDAFFRMVYEGVGYEIDKFLTPRPWWMIVQEPHTWQMPSILAASEVAAASTNENGRFHNAEKKLSAVGISPPALVLERYHQLFEPYFRLLSNVQYFNDSATCQTAPLFLGRSSFVDPGLGAIMKAYFAVHSGNRFSLMNMYVSQSNRPNDSAAFISGHDCPHLLNKWLCAFLPLTYCPVPRLIRDCRGGDCVNRIRNTVGFSLVFNESTDRAVPLESRTGPLWRHVQHSVKAPRTAEQMFWHVATTQMPPLSFRAPYQQHGDGGKPEVTLEAERALFTFGFFLRQNSYFRSQVAQRVAEMRSASAFPATERCVAVHIRRGDRVPQQEIQNFTSAAMLAVAHGPPSAAVAGYAIVDGRVPFAAITLPHILTAATGLVAPSVRTLFVVTDDEEWLVQQQQQLSPPIREEWKIVYLRAPVSHSSPSANSGSDEERHAAAYHETRDGGTASGVLLHGSFTASRQCEAFVGHFGSSVSLLIYTAMCFGHNGTMGACPPVVNMDHYQPLQLHLPKQK